MGGRRIASANQPTPRSPSLGGEQVLYPPQRSPLKVVEENHQLVDKDAEQARAETLSLPLRGRGFKPKTSLI